MPDLLTRRPTQTDVDTEVVLAAVRGFRNLDLPDVATQLERFYPATRVWSTMSKLAEQRTLDCSSSIRFAWIVNDTDQPACESCGTDPAWQVLDPFLLEVHDDLVVTALCGPCHQARREEI